jgi:hypothetical protein
MKSNDYHLKSGLCVQNQPGEILFKKLFLEAFYVATGRYQNYVEMISLPLSLTKKGWSSGHSASMSTRDISGTLCGAMRNSSAPPLSSSLDGTNSICEKQGNVSSVADPNSQGPRLCLAGSGINVTDRSSAKNSKIV